MRYIFTSLLLLAATFCRGQHVDTMTVNGLRIPVLDTSIVMTDSAARLYLLPYSSPGEQVRSFFDSSVRLTGVIADTGFSITTGTGFITSYNCGRCGRFDAYLNAKYDEADKNLRKYKRMSDRAIKASNIKNMVISAREYNYWMGIRNTLVQIINEFNVQ